MAKGDAVSVTQAPVAHARASMSGSGAHCGRPIGQTAAAPIPMPRATVSAARPLRTPARVNRLAKA
jgi:hypothetical protein